MPPADPSPRKSVIFLDSSVLVTPSGGIEPGALGRLNAFGDQYRLGLLCNLPPGHDEASFRLLLRDHGLEAWFEPALRIIASLLPTPLPDPRAFAAARAIAGGEAPTFVTANAGLGRIAEQAGWLTEVVTLAGGVLLVGEIDEDRGPTYVLRGRIVTMDATGTVIPAGRLVIRAGLIAGVLRPGEPLPAGIPASSEIDTGCTLYPGLIDLHNHIPYNVIPLWKVPRQYNNRSQWMRHKDYKLTVSNPVVAMAGHDPTARAIARYVEAKALMGGVTTGQGMRMKIRSITRHFVGAQRNVEATRDARLPAAATRVPDLKATSIDDVENFRRNLRNYPAYFYHLSEGVDVASHRHFANLVENNLIGGSLVGIHSLGLQPADFNRLAAAKAKVVWSPFSNLLLYGKTLDLPALLASGVTFALGCDWSPSGSKNLFCELKVARWVAQRQGVSLSDERLVRLVTSEAAKVVAWDQQLGALRRGLMADVVALKGVTGDPYAQLIGARERDVMLVTVHGIPRHGDRRLMTALDPQIAALLEEVTVDGAAKALYLEHPAGTLNNLSYADARRRLQSAMSDLPKFVRDHPPGGGGLLADTGTSMSLVLDMDCDEDGSAAGLLAAGLLAITPDQVADSVPLDDPESSAAAFLATVAQITHLPDGLAAHLAAAYSS